MSYTDSMDDIINFGISQGFDTRFAGVDSDRLAVMARSDEEAREELYRRLEPAMNRAVASYVRRYPRIEEGECIYAIYLATERSIRKFDPERTTFIRYWSTCASRALVKCTVRAVPRPGEVEMDDVRDEGVEDRCSLECLDGFFDQARRSGEDARSIICLILRMADYSNEEIGEMMDMSGERVRAEHRAALRRFRIYAQRRREAERLYH